MNQREIYKPSVEAIAEELGRAKSIDDFLGKEGIFAKLFARTLEEMLSSDHLWPDGSTQLLAG